MTVSAQTPIKRSTANGVTTVFPYDFKILAAADLEVSLDGVVKTLTTDYTLSGVGDYAGGNVTMLSAPANGAIVVRRRNMAYTREVDYQDQGELPTDTLDDDQDAPILMIQQVAEGLSRAVSLPPESSGVSLELPTPGALQYLRWNAAADALESVLLADVSLISLTAYAQTLLNAVDAAAARLVLGITTFGSSLVTAANAAAARIAMGAAASGANSDITSLTGLTTPLSTAQGGTGRNTTELQNYVYIRDEKPDNTAGGAATSGSWQTRTLNTEVSDTGGLAALSSNQVTLAAGTYIVESRAPAFACARHQIRLQNVTAGTTLLLGSGTYSSPSDPTQTDSQIKGGVITVAAGQAIELQHRVQTSASGDGYGIAINFGVTNIFSEITFRKVA